jgi:hypothetical protein
LMIGACGPADRVTSGASFGPVHSRWAVRFSSERLALAAISRAAIGAARCLRAQPLYAKKNARAKRPRVSQSQYCPRGRSRQTRLTLP